MHKGVSCPSCTLGVIFVLNNKMYSIMELKPMEFLLLPKLDEKIKTFNHAAKNINMVPLLSCGGGIIVSVINKVVNYWF